MKIEKWFEKINLFFYPFRRIFLVLFQFFDFVFFGLVFASVVYYHGYPQTIESKQKLISLISMVFSFYFFNYLIGFFAAYTYDIKVFLFKRWMETLAISLFIVEAISSHFFGFSLFIYLLQQIDGEHLLDIGILFFQLYFLSIILFRLFTRKEVQFSIFKLHPVVIFLGAFLLLIATGTFLLSLPEMVHLGKKFELFDAFFLAVSAGCVTGLSVHDISEVLTFKGHLVLLFLMKLGGINIVAFGSFITLLARFGIGTKQHPVIEDIMLRDNMVSSRGVMEKVIFWGTFIEMVGAVGLYIFQDPLLYKNTQERIFNAIFHAVSAFNNAGFSIFPEGFQHVGVAFNYPFIAIVGLLIFMGSLSFIAIFDIFNFKNIQERIQKPWKQFAFPSKIALYFSIIFLVIGGFLFFVLEYDYSLRYHSFFGKIVTSFFHSVTTRTAGFTTLDLEEVSLSSLFLFLALMLIGASSGSTGGGVKTSSFALLYASFVASVRGFSDAVLFKRTIPKDLIYRAFSTFFLFLISIFFFTFLLSITEAELLKTKEFLFFDLLFEEFSAINTVGLSLGLTSQMSQAGQFILATSMFLGRTGTILIAFLLVNNKVATKYSYPEEHFLVG